MTTSSSGNEVAYQAAKVLRDALEAEERDALAAIPPYEPTALGLMPDAVKKTPQWRAYQDVRERRFKYMAWMHKSYHKLIDRDSRAARDEFRAKIAAMRQEQGLNGGGS